MKDKGSPYKGLSAYDEEDSWAFFGREKDTRLVIANVLTSKLTIVYGPSGVGKSSLVNARLASGLRGKASDVKVFRDWRTDIAEEIGRWFTNAGASHEAASGPAVLVLDQFEESLAYPQPGLEQAIAELLTSGASVHVLIVIREDALAKLDIFDGLVEGLFDNLYRLDHLDSDAAREAIKGPIRELAERDPEFKDALVEDAVVDLVLDEAEIRALRTASHADRGAGSSNDSRPRRIETTYLQLVMHRLWMEESHNKPTALRFKTLTEALGGPKKIVGSHVKDAMQSLPSSEHATAAAVTRLLAPASGRKIAYTVDELAEHAAEPRTAVGKILNRLAEPDLRILRAVPSGKPGEPAYELFHDTLVEPIVDWRRAFDVEREKEAIRRRNRRRIVPALISALVATTAAAVFAVTQMQYAKHQAALASHQAAVASRAQVLAEQAESAARTAGERLERSVKFRQRLFSTPAAQLPSVLLGAPRDNVLQFDVDVKKHPHVTKSGGPTYRFYITPSKVPPEVATIIYFIPHKTFGVPFMFSGPSDRKFAVEWDGVGCLSRIFAIIEHTATAEGEPITVSPIAHCEAVKPLLEHVEEK